ncbi:DUF4293 domain-containing protein [Tenacibaculum jejuense]|uniref:Transcription termination factor Rho n=1 Tax=Tenacibaculum jejuense TaxID=584609 RepID=A0A238UDY5_9FLAO|nr:DUF4293 domain-containing protein [Tenacibaculum jejuense]SNR17265.1 conserved membrane protein of unknown function [Tenacibaculum jejuense]
MIQRIQSLYLLAVGIISGGLTFVFNLWSTAKQAIFSLDLLGAASFLQKSIPVLFILSALLSIVTIFLFKNRQLQFVLGRLNILTNLFLLGVLVYLSLTLSGEATVSEKGIGMFIPVISILLLVLANKAIKKDEDLVKSVDRLR